MDFNNEFGHWYINDRHGPVHHRLKRPDSKLKWKHEPVCRIQPHVWLSNDYTIIYKNICKTCLNTYTKEEIIDLKQYLITKKLMGR